MTYVVLFYSVMYSNGGDKGGHLFCGVFVGMDTEHKSGCCSRATCCVASRNRYVTVRGIHIFTLSELFIKARKRCAIDRTFFFGCRLLALSFAVDIVVVSAQTAASDEQRRRCGKDCGRGKNLFSEFHLLLLFAVMTAKYVIVIRTLCCARPVTK